MKSLTNTLRPLRKRIMAEQRIHDTTSGLIVGIGLAILLLIVSKFILINHLAVFAFAGIFLCGAVGFFVAVIKRPTYDKVAIVGDSLGFKERFSTAMELLAKNTQGVVATLVIDDAILKAKTANFQNLYPVRMPKKKLQAVAILLVGLFVVGYMPSPKADELAKQQKIQVKIAEEIKSIEKAQKELFDQTTVKKAKEINANVDKLVKELKKSKTEAEAIQALQKTQEELKKISKDSVSKDLKALGEKLASHEKTRELGERLQKGDMDAVEEDMKKFSELIENATEEERKEIADILTEAALELAENTELAQSLDQLNGTIGNGDFSGLNAAMSQVGSQISELASEDEELREALEAMNQSLAESNQNLSSQKNQNNSQQGQGEKEGQGQGEGQGEGQGQGQAQGQGEGQGQAQGQGQSQGQGQGGSGRGKGHVENENIYSRKAEGLQDYEAKIQGMQNESGTMEEQEQKGIGNTGGTVPYDQVISAYRPEELKALEDYEIPHGMKELVKEYFSTLE